MAALWSTSAEYGVRGHSGTLAQARPVSPGSRFIRKGTTALSGVAPSIGPA